MNLRSRRIYSCHRTAPRFRMDLTACRLAGADDVTAMDDLRRRSGWTGGAGAERVRAYLAGTHTPRDALAPRAVFVAESHGDMLGYIAGHLTTRMGCDGELQWLLVERECRRGGMAHTLLVALTAWFAARGARRICVNVEPANEEARRFYGRHGAESVDTHWLVWRDLPRSIEGSDTPKNES